MSAAALEQVAAQRRNATDPPNLRGTLLARSNPRHRLDLHTLDEFDRDDEKDA